MAGRKESAYFDQAERLYVVEGKTFAQIIEALLGQVSERTLSNWKDKGGWEQKRAAYLASKRDPLSLLRGLYGDLLGQIETRRQDAIEALDFGAINLWADSLAKLDAQIRRLESQQYDKRAVCLEAMRHFVDWLKGKSPIKDDPEGLAGQERLVTGFLQELERG